MPKFAVLQKKEKVGYFLYKKQMGKILEKNSKFNVKKIEENP